MGKNNQTATAAKTTVTVEETENGNAVTIKAGILFGFDWDKFYEKTADDSDTSEAIAYAYDLMTENLAEVQIPIPEDLGATPGFIKTMFLMGQKGSKAGSAEQ